MLLLKERELLKLLQVKSFWLFAIFNFETSFFKNVEVMVKKIDTLLFCEVSL